MAILLAVWALTAQTSMNLVGAPGERFPTEAACVAAAKKRVEMGKQNKAKANTFGAAFARAHHLDPNNFGSFQDYDVTWECREMRPGGRVVTGP
jgi:hypothetical protein